MRMENQHWMRWHGIVGVVPSVCLLFTSICFHRGRGRFSAETSARIRTDRSAIRENGMRGKKKKRKGRGKVIIGGPWRYACGVSLRFLINFHPIPLPNIYRPEREETIPRILVRLRVGTQWCPFVFSLVVFIYLFFYLFFFFLFTRRDAFNLRGRFLCSVSGQFQGGCRAPFGDFLREFN